MKRETRLSLSKYEVQSEIALLLFMSLIIYGFSFAMRVFLFGPQWDVRTIALTGIIPIAAIWMISHAIKKFPLWVIMLIGPFIALGAEILHEEIYHQTVLQKFSWQREDYSFQRYVEEVYFSSLIYFAWLFGYFTITNHFRFVRESLVANDARMEAQTAQLSMLRYQINPHFLFNTLNSISALVLSKQTKDAETMIVALSRFLRYSLDKNHNVKIPLEQEFDITREYLSIEKIRFQDKLNVEFKVSEDAKACLIPSLILQPAIENAIKHAIAPMKTKGYIRIEAAIDNMTLRICVTDNGSGFDPQHKPAGIGLKNMRNRIKAIYGKHGNMSMENAPDGGARVTITLPVEQDVATCGSVKL